MLTFTVCPARASSGPVHEIVKGDTLGAIASRHGVSVRELIAANGLSGPRATLKVGRRLAIPRAEASIPPLELRPQSTGKAARSRDPRKRIATVAPPPTMLMAVPPFGREELVSFEWPVDGAASSYYGRRRKGWHRGVDIVAPQGAPVLASALGVVVASGVEPRYGRVVKIEHEHGFMTVYAHNTENLVEVGDPVSAGQLIARIGRTGRATSPHLHFEIRRHGHVVNPLYLLPLPPRVSTEEVLEEPDEPDEPDE